MACFYGNHPKIRLSENQHYFRYIFLLMCNIERHMRYQIILYYISPIRWNFKIS